MTNFLYLKTQAMKLIRRLDQEPELLTHIQAPFESTELTKKPKTGEKIHSGKPIYHRDIDYTAVDLKTDLIIALGKNDYDNIARNYYSLIHLLGI